jgi:putative transposase
MLLALWTTNAAHVEALRQLLNGEIFYTLREAQIVIESWRHHYNTIRPHASIGYKPPAPEVLVPAFAAWPAVLPNRFRRPRWRNGQP